MKNRRQFLKSTTTVAAGTSIALTASAQSAKIAPLRLGIIGPGGMGMNHLRGFAGFDDVEITHVCDADANRMAKAAKEVEQRQGGKAPIQVADMRRIFEDASVDAVVIATPDHWHTPASIMACDAGKHVYVEKPISHNVREGRLLIEAAKRHNVMVQHGTQSRSTPHVRRAMELLHDGAIGEVLTAKAWNSQRRSSIGKTRPSDPPNHLDFDLWLGPAPKVPFRANMLPSIWRWWFDYGCGDIGNDGVHDLDIARWGLGTDEHPVKVAALGGKYFFDDDMQWPDTHNVLYEYAANAKTGRPRQLLFEQRIWSPYVQEGYENGNAFYGTKGLLVMSKGSGFKLYGERNKLLDQMEGRPDLTAHQRNFIDSIRGETKPNADAKVAHLSSSLCHWANIAVRCGRLLQVNPKTETIANDDEANALVARAYRDHWAAPRGV